LNKSVSNVVLLLVPPEVEGAAVLIATHEEHAMSRSANVVSEHVHVLHLVWVHQVVKPKDSFTGHPKESCVSFKLKIYTHG